LSLPEYTFVPWLRRGLAAEITAVDDLGTQPQAAAPGRPTLDVELTLDVAAAPGTAAPPRPSITRTVQILGAGDVAMLKDEAILRTHPKNGALGATPDELAFVEFYDEDLPWRYTPARATGSRLRPWLALLVLTPEEFTIRDRGEHQPPVLTLSARAQLPPAAETWAWAHAQLSGPVTLPTDPAALGPAIGAAIESDLDHARSRLLSPRRLLGGAQYHAFLVPAFETGRLAGLGRALDTVPSLEPSWGQPQHDVDRDLPVYHQFSFRTSLTGDFETLARRLKPEPVGDKFGKRDMDVSRPGYGLETRDGAVAGLEGALAPPHLSRDDFDPAWDDVAADLERTLDAGADALAAPAPGQPRPRLLVVPPAYGRLHVGIGRVLDAREAGTVDDPLFWLAELNLDVRNRAAAGLGTETVRRRQDELVQRAWEQVGRIEEANQRLREAELARAAAEAIMRKHVEPLAGDDRLTQLTAPAQDGLGVPASLPVVDTTPGPPDPGSVAPTASLRAAVQRSRVPASAQSPAFRRLTRAQRPLMRRLGAGGRPAAFQADLIAKMDAAPEHALTAAPAAPAPDAGVLLETVEAAVTSAANAIAAHPPRVFEIFLELAAAEVAAEAPTQDFDTLAAATFVTALAARVRAHWPAIDFDNAPPAPGTTERRVWDLAHAVVAVASDGIGRARLTVSDAAFLAEFSNDALGKARGPVTVVREGPPPAGATIGRTTSAEDAQKFELDLQRWGNGLAGRRDPDPGKELDAGRVKSHLLTALAPMGTLGAAMTAAVPQIAGRAARRLLAPVQAYPTFPDPMFDALRALGQDYVLPNVADLPRESLTVMQPNRRFIESYLAGANFGLNQELLWREYPTDQRGTPFRVFWDARDGIKAPDRTDIDAIDAWTGALGSQAPDAGSVLVLVVRGELLERFPDTFIFAQKAMFPGGDAQALRQLDTTVAPVDPIFAGRLEPDIRLVGFPLSVEEARGRRDPAPVDPGYFFVFMERPGEPRFGADAGDEAPPLDTWDALAWATLKGPPGSPFVNVDANAGLAPTTPASAVWGRTSADQASILLQSPALIARHASEMLP
jgi:hypothetical protein